MWNLNLKPALHLIQDGCSRRIQWWLRCTSELEGNWRHDHAQLAWITLVTPKFCAAQFCTYLDSQMPFYIAILSLTSYYDDTGLHNRYPKMYWLTQFTHPQIFYHSYFGPLLHRWLVLHTSAKLLKTEMLSKSHQIHNDNHDVVEVDGDVDKRSRRAFSALSM